MRKGIRAVLGAAERGAAGGLLVGAERRRKLRRLQRLREAVGVERAHHGVALHRELQRAAGRHDLEVLIAIILASPCRCSMSRKPASAISLRNCSLSSAVLNSSELKAFAKLSVASACRNSNESSAFRKPGT